VKWIHTLHDIQLTDPSGGESLAWSKTSKARIWRGFWSWRRKMEFGAPDALISPTQWLMSWHADAGFKGKQTVIIPNPIEIMPTRERAPHHPATIVFVGRLSKDKGFDIFLKALARIPDVHVSKALVVGGGDMMATAERGRDHRLMLRGALSFEDARRAIAEADLLIAPSQILENQQTILLEAMAEGTPAIATDVGGTRETLEVTGCPVISINSQQDQDIADAAISILSDSEEWMRHSALMRKQAEEVHAAEKYFDALVKLF
jgi:glycosyltransferase involved in cell wall biosynthesis